MSASFDGDLIRPLGLVTLYFAYAEAELEELLEVLSHPEPLDESQRQWPVGRKLAHAQTLVERLGTHELADLTTTLGEARALFEKRNSLVHSCIFAGGRVVSSRGVPDQHVTPSQLTELAESIFSWKERIYMHRRRHLHPVLAAPREASGT
jgi:hypothetical protein